MTVKPIPDGYHTVTPYLIVHDAASAIDFYKRAFGAKECMRFADPGGRIGHAEIRIGDTPIMLADEHAEFEARAPRSYGGTPVRLLLYVPDVDAFARQAMEAGARELRPVQDQFYGDRAGTFEDPFGHVWTLATHREDVSLEEMLDRYDVVRKQGRSTGGEPPHPPADGETQPRGD